MKQKRTQVQKLKNESDPRPEAVAASPSRRERKKLARRQRIYRAAVSLFMAQGYDETTIDDITEEADVGRATFFNHYASKAAVLHEIAGQALAYARRTFDREFARESVPLAEKLKRSLERFGEIVERNPRYYETVFLDAMRSQAGFVATNRERSDDLIDVLTEHLRNEQKRGSLDTAYDAGQLAEMLTGIYMYSILSYIRRGCSDSLVQRMGRAAEIFLRGCQARADE